MSELHSVPEVEIDSDGVFKYILVRVSLGKGESEQYRDIVRGTKTAEYHNHIFESINPELTALGFECKCLGGGKIEHNSKDKKIRVFGESTFNGRFNYALYKVNKAISAEETHSPLVCNRESILTLYKNYGYGKADHSITGEKLKKAYSGYEVIWSDDKK